jgi:hypothetical protein
MSGLNRRSRFNTFSYCGTSEAYDKGFDVIQWGGDLEESEAIHKGWAGYRLKRVKREGEEVKASAQMHNVKGQHRAPRTEYRENFDRIFGGDNG